jgi:hypothetical protein
MPLTSDEFRAMALRFAEAVEGSHMDHPDFRGGGRIFASLTSDGERAMVKLPLPLQAEFVKGPSGAFTPASGAWGRAGCTMVDLSIARKADVRRALKAAWQLRMSRT